MSDCWFCGGPDYHPDCDHPACSNDTHGHGPEGKTVTSYCGQHGGEEA